MIIFNDLRLSDDKKNLIVNCNIQDIDEYEGAVIDSIYLEYYKNFPATYTVSDKAIPLVENGQYDYYVNPDDSSIPGLIRDAEDKGYVDVPTVEQFGTSTYNKGVFFVIVRCIAVDGETVVTEIGVVLDWKFIYEQGVGYIDTLASHIDLLCDMPAGFEQFIIIWNAFRLALATSDFSQVSALWNKFLKLYDIPGLPSGCEEANNGGPSNHVYGCGCN